MSTNIANFDELRRMAKAEREKQINEAEREFKAKMDAIAWMQKATRTISAPSRSVEITRPLPALRDQESDTDNPPEAAGEPTGTILDKVRAAVLEMKGEFSLAQLSASPSIQNVNKNTMGSCIRKLIGEDVMEAVETTGKRNRRYRLK